jgi:alpha-beta hydrolase superfamily lysophospholipase
MNRLSRIFGKRPLRVAVTASTLLLLACSKGAMAGNAEVAVAAMGTPAEAIEIENLPESPVIKQAVDLLSDSKNQEAKQVLLDAAKSKDSTESSADVFYLLALTEFNDGDLKAAAADLQRVLDMPAIPPRDARSQALLLRRIGDCYFDLRDFAKARSNYQSALTSAASLSAADALLAKLNESMLACFEAEKNYDQAVPYAHKLLEVAKKRAESGRLDDKGDLLWAYIDNMDLYRRLGSQYDADRLRLRGEVMSFLEPFLIARSQMQSAGQLPTLDDFKKSFLAGYVAANHPKTVAEYLWLSSEFKMRTLPLIAWFPTEKAQAAILCIHGLGLENRAFTRFGEAMSKRGFAVYAMDVRGFGSWQNIPGQEDVQFEYALQDVGGVIGLIKQRNPQLPVFLLGESMGGGIALQAAARFDDQLSGVVASVPSPDRFQEGRADISVAVHFLKGRNKSFDIGTMVTQKATANPVVLQAWTNDPKAKMDMTPRELMQFDKFMRATKQQCAQILHAPVFIVQGGHDRLVKPEGSQELYNAVGTDDKSLIIIGDAEHLIFETERPSPVLLDALSSWMCHRKGSTP